MTAKQGLYLARDEYEAEMYASGAKRAPKGGLAIAGKHYSGGQWIPGEEVQKASPEQKAQLDAAQEASEHRAQARHAERTARGPANRETLEKKLAGHLQQADAQAGFIAGADKKAAQSAWNVIERHHGANALHRVEELADLAQKAMQRLKPGDFHRQILTRELLKLHHIASVLAQKPAPTREERHASAVAKIKAMVQSQGLDLNEIVKGLGGHPAGEPPLAQTEGSAAPGVEPASAAPTPKAKRQPKAKPVPVAAAPRAPADGPAKEAAALDSMHAGHGVRPEHLAKAMQSADTQRANLVPLHELRGQFPHLSDEQFKDAVKEHQRGGTLTLSAIEGRHGVSDEQRRHAIPEEGTGRLLGYASLRR